ncbi:MAG TPA: hypothetical protein VGK35_12595 [Actinotalea sp.]
MPRAPDLLHRFLPAGSPGAAGVAGVPTDQVADVAAELAPVFARLAPIDARCDEILDQGRRDAAETAQRTADQVRSILANAQQRAAGERADAMARAQKAIEQETSTELGAAHAQAAELQADAAERLPGYVARITAAVGDLLAAPRAERAS